MSALPQDKVLEQNPGVDREVVEEFERVRAELAKLGAEYAPATYRLDLPFSVNMNRQPVFSQVLRIKPQT